MKKLIALIGALNLYVSAIASVTSCSENSNEEDTGAISKPANYNYESVKLNEETVTQVQEINNLDRLQL